MHVLFGGINEEKKGTIESIMIMTFSAIMIMNLTTYLSLYMIVKIQFCSIIR